MAHYFLAVDPLPLVVVYSPKCASQTIRAWCQAAIEEASGQPVADVDPYLVGPAGADRCAEHWKVFFVRDPLCRLVSFYAQWVVADQTRWCFADAARRISLRGKTFRQFLFALEHLDRHGLERQHHLIPQTADIDAWRFDEVLPVERLQQGLDALSRRFGLSAPVGSLNRRRYTDGSLALAIDRDPDWLRRNGVPGAAAFYDREALEMVAGIYARDIDYYKDSTGLDVIAAMA